MISLVMMAQVSIERDIMRVPYSQHHIPPIVIRDDNFQAVAGILFDTVKLITDEAGLGVKLLSVPRKRISQFLIERQLDLHCIANPAWYTDQQLSWSESIFPNADIVVTHKQIKHINALLEQPSFSLGTVLGYRYPELEQALESGKIKRADSVSSRGSMARFIKGELDGFVIAKNEANYLMHLDRFNYFEINNTFIHCAYGPSLSSQTQQKLNSAITRLKEKQAFKTMLQQYIR